MDVPAPEQPDGRSPFVGRDGLPSLTGLRFVAAALVVTYHLSRQIGRPAAAADLVWYGRAGVSFFFVLSGVVLAWTYCGRMPALRVFWWRRFARIWPLHVVATTLSVGVYVALGRPPSIRGVAAAVPLLHAWVPAFDVLQGGNGATWSLSDEAFFYAIFPLLLAAAVAARAGARTALAVLAATVVSCVVLWAAAQVLLAGSTRVWFLDYFPPTRALQFVVGVAAGTALANGWRPRLRLWPAVAAAVGYHALLVPWMHVVPDAAPWGPYSASQLFAVPFYLWVILAAASRDLGRRPGPLSAPWLLRLGHWSFAWYLTHEIVVRLAKATWELPTSTGGLLAVWAAVLVVSQAVAALLYTCVERPLERRLRPLVRGPVRPAGPGRAGPPDPAAVGAPGAGDGAGQGTQR